MRSQNDNEPEMAVVKLFMDNVVTFKEMIFESSKQQDNVAVWLVGMSTGAVALIVSQYTKFTPDSHSALKWTVIILTVTIISGMLFRILHLFLQGREQHDLMVIMGWLSGHQNKPAEVPIELPADSSAEFIASRVFNLLGIERGPDWGQYIEMDNDVEYWRNQYEENVLLYNRLQEAKLQVALEKVKEIQSFIANLNGEPVDKFQRTPSEDRSTGIRKRRLKRSCEALYVVMCISFAVSVIFISLSFVNADLKKIDPSAKTSQTVISPAKQAEVTGTDMAK